MTDNLQHAMKPGSSQASECHHEALDMARAGGAEIPPNIIVVPRESHARCTLCNFPQDERHDGPRDGVADAGMYARAE